MKKLHDLIQRKSSKVILFADISGSSILYKVLGNSAAKAIIDDQLEQARQIVEKFFGKVIKTIGDEIMVQFDDPERALHCAISIQTSRQSKGLNHDHPVLFSIGIGFGEIIEHENDFFGGPVNDAAHLTKMAKGDQILITEEFWRNLRPNSQVLAREFDKVILKGANLASVIYRVYWQQGESSQSETQLMSGELVNQHIQVSKLQLAFRENDLVIDEYETPFIIGRDALRCDLVLEGQQVSREHCRITFSRGKFVLIDHSTNGCFVKPNGKEEFYLRSEEYPLTEPVELSLGVSVADSGRDSLYLKINNY